MTRNRFYLISFMVVAAVAAGPAVSFGPATQTSAEVWPDYRGPLGDGHAIATGLPLKWSETENVRWKTPIPGRGWSSPVILGGQIWLTTATPDGTKMSVICVDRETGKILLNRVLFETVEPDPINDVNSYASPSAIVESGRVYVHFGMYGTACLDTKSFETVWQRRDIRCKHSVGPGASPVVFEDKLILTMDGVDTQYVIALDKTTGSTAWKTERSAELGVVGPEGRKSFCTPLLVSSNSGTILVTPGARAFYGYDPRTGKEIWRVKHPGYSIGSRPVVADGVAYMNTGYDRSEVWAVRLGGQGDATSSNVIWKCQRGMPYKPSPLVIDRLLYLIGDDGMATCLDAKSGETVWKERLGGHFSASPLYAEGRIYCFSEDGKISVLKPGRKLEVIAESQLADGFMASAAVAGKAFYLRSKTHLYRIEDWKATR